MPLRPIDAIFVNPKKRLYVIYYRGALWQLPRMKIDDAAWQRRLPYSGDIKELYLSRVQTIKDPILAARLRTLNLPEAVRGSTLAQFERWWETQGYYWLKDIVDNHQSPLAVHESELANPSMTTASIVPTMLSSAAQNNTDPDASHQKDADKNIFDDMLADLVNEVLNLK